MTEAHPDPIGDSGQKAAQYVQVLAMAAEAVAVIMKARARAAAERDGAKADAINTDLLANHKAAAQLWQPVLLDHQRDKLDVAQTLTAWAAAQGWRETDPDADRASDLAEERLTDLRPAAMMRYDDLRNEGLDPVTAMRQVVPLLETDPRIGEPAPQRAALTETAALDAVDSLTDQGTDLETGRDIDAGRMPDTVQTRELADELNDEHDGYEPPYGLSGYELKYGVEDRMAAWPHRGFDDDPTMPEVTSVNYAGVDPVSVILVETVLLAEIEAHRQAAAHAAETAGTENHIAEQLTATHDDLSTPRVDKHAEAVAQAQAHLVAVDVAGATVSFERNAEQAIASSYPTAMTDVSAVTATAAANAPADLTATLATKPAVAAQAATRA